MEDPNSRIYVPMALTADDWHLTIECIRAVSSNLRDDMDAADRAHVRRRCAEVILKIEDFIVETNHLIKESQHELRTEGMDRDSSSSDFYRAVFRGKRET